MEVAKKVNIPEFLTGGGEMGERIRNFDWGKTALGEPENWEQSLKTCVRIMLTSPQPMFVWWGKDLINIYNDAYRFVMGEKHPHGLGKSGRDVWKEIWSDVWQRGEIVFNKNEGTFDDALLLLMNRYGYIEETYFKFSYNPIPGDNGGTEGLFCACTEETQRVVNDRSLETLGKLSAYAIGCQYEKDIFEKAALALSENQHDFPFTIMYKINEDASTAELRGCSIIQKGDPGAPEIIDLTKIKGQVWPISKAMRKREPLLVDDINKRIEKLPYGSWNISPQQAIILPIHIKGEIYPTAVLVAGLNPYRKLDDKYMNLMMLIVEQLIQSFVNVNIIEAERKRVEAIEELDKAKTLFFSNISHEFRTPITLMLGPLEELLSKPALNLSSSDKQNLEATHRNAMRLLKLVNTLLDFSRIESGRQEAYFQLTDLKDFTTNLASNFQSSVEKAGLKYEVKAQNIMPPVYIDKQMWEKIVFNLLSNAFKYTLEGSITVRLFADRNEAVFQVIDTGVGIPEKELPHMFERFHRVENSFGRTFEGTGIGLSLTKELVQMHGGRISVESKEGEGSTFTVRIPFGNAHLPASKIKEPIENYLETISDLYVEEVASLLSDVGNSVSDTTQSHNEPTTPTILIVDDNADMRQYIQSIIGSKYKTITAANGLNALHKINQEMPSLILSDIMMPVMDGIELLKQVKNNKATAHIPVILITARAGEESKVEGYETGADDYLVKPFSLKELLARIHSQLRLVASRKRIERQLRDFFMQSPIAIAVLKGENFIVEIANKKVLDFWDRTEKEIVGKPIFDGLGEVAGQGFEDLLLNVLRTGERYIDEERSLEIMRNGMLTRVYVKFIYEPLIEEDGSISGVIVMVDEITDQVLARMKMEEANRELQISATLTQSIVDAVIGTDMNFNIISWNHGAEKMYGYSMEEVIGKSGREILKTKFLSEADQSEWRAKLEASGWWRGEVVQHRRDGSAIPVMVSIAYVMDDKGNPIGAVGVNRDITEQKAFYQNLEAKVRERTSQLKSSLDILNHAEQSANMGNWQWNLTTNTLKWSDNLYKLFGFEPNEIEPTFENFINIIHPEDREKVMESNKNAFENRQPTEDIFKIITKQGQVKYIKGIGSKMKLDNDDILIGTSQDITPLQTKNLELKRTNEELKSFNYVASHDLQEPLRKIQIFIDLLQRNSQDPVLSELYLSKIKNASQRMSELIKSVLEYARLADRTQAFQETDLNQTLKEVLSDYELVISEKKAVIKSHDLPKIKAVPLQMQQLFANMISNSLKFSKKEPEISITYKIVKGDEITFTHGFNPETEFIILNFTDNGIGFSNEYNDKILQLFKRLHSTTEYPGSGVGLSIVKKIVEHHQGFMSATSEIDQGATFTICLPK